MTLKRPAILLVTGIAAALFAACYLQAAFVFCLCALTIVVCVGALLLFRKKHAGPIVVCIACGLLIGFSAWYLNVAVNYMPVAQYDGETGVLTCTVAEYPNVYEKYTSVIVHTETFSGERMKRTKVLLYLDGNHETLTPGDLLTARVTFAVPESRWNFDKFRYYRARRIYLTADAAELTEITPGGTDLRYLPVKLTRLCTNRLRELMPEENAAILAAFIFGDESGLSDEYVSALRATGLSHITAVSGMNVSFLVGLLLLLFRRKLGSCIAVPVVILFVLMTGGSASVTRAGIMQILWLTAYFVNREADPVNSLFIACGLILLVNPFSIADIGLWLSFFATLGLILLGTPMQRFIMARIRVKARLPRRIFEMLTGALCTTLAAQVFVIPIQMLTFGDISLIAPLSNLLVVPVSEYAFTGGVMALLLSFVWLPLGKVLAFFPRVLTDFQLTVVPALARLPMASISSENIYLILYLTFLYLFGLLWFWKRPRRPAVLICCVIASLSLVILCGSLDAALLSRVSIVDTVGGQSVVVCDRDANLVVNCGGGYESACTAVLDELRRSNAREISLFVLTDYRTASAGNAVTLLKSMNVKAILLPETEDETDITRYEEIAGVARESGTEILKVSDGAYYTYGNVSMQAFENREPGADMGRLMVYLEVSGYRILCLGGMYPENIGYLLAHSSISDIDAVAAGDYYAVRMVPPAVLRYGPELCVFSSYAGADRDVLARVSAFTETVLETERMGCVRVRLPRLYGMAKYYS